MGAWRGYPPADDDRRAFDGDGPAIPMDGARWRDWGGGPAAHGNLNPCLPGAAGQLAQTVPE
eukprot:11159607-Lingulodinium_polyedra.AAC.1